MRLNIKRRLAVNAMIDLALHEQGGPVALATVAKRQQVTVCCLEPVFAQLRMAGLVDSIRGPGGGYILSRDAAAISVAAIVGAVEAGHPGADENDGRASLARDLAQRLGAVMQAHMAAIPLAGLVADLLAAQRDAAVLLDARPHRSEAAPHPHRHHSPTASIPNVVLEQGTAMARAGAGALAR